MKNRQTAVPRLGWTLLHQLCVRVGGRLPPPRRPAQRAGGRGACGVWRLCSKTLGIQQRPLEVESFVGFQGGSGRCSDAFLGSVVGKETDTRGFKGRFLVLKYLKASRQRKQKQKKKEQTKVKHKKEQKQKSTTKQTKTHYKS